MKVIVQTANDRYVFPEAELVEFEHSTALHFQRDEDLPGIVVTTAEEDEERC